MIDQRLVLRLARTAADKSKTVVETIKHCLAEEEEEVSPSGVFLRVQVKPLDTTRNGFTVAIVFPEDFPQSATISGGHVVVTRARNKRILLANSMAHNRDISMFGSYTFYLQIRNLNDFNPRMLTALVGFYNKRTNFDVSCILTENPVVPLPSTTTRATTRPPTTVTRTTTRSTTTERVTTTLPTTQPTNQDGDCEMLSQESYVITNTGWKQGETFNFQAKVVKRTEVQ